MTPKMAARLQALREKAKGSVGLTGPEDVEYGDLLVARHAEITEMTPVPTCCEDAKKHPSVHFEASLSEDDDSRIVQGRWWVAVDRVDSMLGRALAAKNRSCYVDVYPPEPKFCPYCGTALPRMRCKNPVPKNVCRSDGYYCETCQERDDDCLCDPLASAFEPEP